MMDYSVKNILVMLQDLQRINFGRITMYIDIFCFEDSNPTVTASVFDRDGEVHGFYFYSFSDDDVRRDEYVKVRDLINDIINV